MSEILIGKVEKFVHLKDISCSISCLISTNLVLKNEAKIKLLTPENETIETFIKGFGRPIEPRNKENNPNLTRIGIRVDYTERNKKGFPKGTEIYLIDD